MVAGWILVRQRFSDSQGDALVIMEASRQLLWNIHGSSFLNIGTALVTVSFLSGFLLRIRGWMKGTRVSPAPDRPARMRATLRALISHRGMLRGRFYLLAHRCIFYGMTLLFIGTLLVAAQQHGIIERFHGYRYLLFSLVLDMAGIAVLVGITMAGYKRYIVKPDRLASGFADAFFLFLLAAVAFSGFLVEGYRLAAQADPWEAWSPAGATLAMLLRGFIDENLALRGHVSVWYGHAVLSFILMALTPWSKLLHMVAVPLHIFFAPQPDARSSLPEASTPTGTGTLAETSRRQMIELDACVNCGRCRKPCTISRGGLPFAPVTLMNTLKRQRRRGQLHVPQIGTAIDEDALWACSTCLACEERCPMNGEHASRIVALRQTACGYGAVPVTVSARFAEVQSALETGPTPCVPSKEVNRVYVWPGCQINRDLSGQLLSSLLKVLEQGGYAPVLLQPPVCCGASLRRLGNEALFQRAAQATIEYLSALGDDLIITPCPHCFNTMKNEYSRLGGSLRIRHHSSVLADLLAEGRLGSIRQLNSTMAFHDPCYLGRYNGEYSAPRAVLAGIAPTAPKELKLSRQKSICCGSGGGTVTDTVARENGRIWLQQAIKEGVETVVTGCPHCRENLLSTLAPGEKRQRVPIVDLVELLEQGEPS